jgi:hypothetical protein
MPPDAATPAEPSTISVPTTNRRGRLVGGRGVVWFRMDSCREDVVATLRLA